MVRHRGGAAMRSTFWPSKAFNQPQFVAVTGSSRDEKRVGGPRSLFRNSMITLSGLRPAHHAVVQLLRRA